MELRAEWRTKGDSESILIVDEKDTVLQAQPANVEALEKLLTEPGDFNTWRGEESIEGDKSDPEAWGSLIIARANTGEIIDLAPERFWSSVYYWFRSRGTDYNLHGKGDSRFANFAAFAPMTRLPDLDFEAMEELEETPSAWMDANDVRRRPGDRFSEDEFRGVWRPPGAS